MPRGFAWIKEYEKRFDILQKGRHGAVRVMILLQLSIKLSLRVKQRY